MGLLRQYIRLPLILLSFLILFAFSGCNNGEPRNLQLGAWRGVLAIQGQQLPFNFEVTSKTAKSYQIHLINGEERITSEDVRIRGDSLFATMHIFDTEFRVHLSKNEMNGVWSKTYSDGYIVPFKASYGKKFRFRSSQEPAVDVSGKWQVSFSKDTIPAVGVFTQEGSKVLGTFITSSGDYRYLEGSVSGDSLFLSAFDGEHAFLFNGRVSGETSIKGEFRSGTHWIETWHATSDDLAELVDQDSITYLRQGYEEIEFSFPDLNGKTVTLNDSIFESKVVILQLFGSWCPNCMDETKFLSTWYNNNRNRPVEIIGLAYERLDNFSYAKTRLNKMAMKFGVNYEILVAGNSNKDSASLTLPMLNHVNAFPTTIFIDHRGKVRRIFTGFHGPGTGQYYTDFTIDFEQFVDGLITEQLSDTTLIDS